MQAVQQGGTQWKKDVRAERRRGVSGYKLRKEVLGERPLGSSVKIAMVGVRFTIVTGTRSIARLEGCISKRAFIVTRIQMACGNDLYQINLSALRNS
jgi:hypothetical protein